MAMSEVSLGPASSPASVVVDPDPYLCGLWGHGCECTMSHQAVREGVPAFQLETPYTLRRAMASDDGTIVEKMAAAIVNLYENVVTQVEAGKGPITDYATALPVPRVIGAYQGSEGGAGDVGGEDEGGSLVDADLAVIDSMLDDIRVLDARDADKQI